ncbi:MAG: hypothetical protein P1P76_08835 [Anaerolineales bacterium]|nr:hypothetical protein [Anaerolineales bacterium]
MEKSQEGQAQNRLNPLDILDTRAANGKRAVRSIQSGRPGVDSGPMQDSTSLRGWLDLAAYWIRELLWRRRFWSRMDRRAVDDE